MPRRVLTAGTFDLIHAGHLRLLLEAKELAGPNGELIVVVARDQNVMRFKGRPPILPEGDRLLILRNLKPVDRAVLGDLSDPLTSIVRAGPDLIVLGYDQWADEAWLRKELDKRGLRIETMRMGKFDVAIPSSKDLVDRVVEIYCRKQDLEE